MNGFTVYQPWAFAIVAGYKGIETRGHNTKIRGHIFIHAAKKHPYHVPGFREAAAALNLATVEGLALGAIIGTVELADCVPVETVINGITERERLLGDYSPGRFAWIMENPVIFETPIPATGKQGWWKWEVTA